jgi:hypothetical protein
MQVISRVDLDHISGIGGQLQTRKIDMMPARFRFITGEEAQGKISLFMRVCRSISPCSDRY